MYEKDIEGNIIGIYDMDSEGRVAKYEYDAWGGCKVCNADGSENTSETFIGNINAFRYKSYYYDSETKLYYLISRYYDPETGRFISPDHMGYMAEQMDRINGCNLYAYCLNNPVMYSDPEGKFGLLLTVLFATIMGAVVKSAISIGKQLIENEGDWSKINVSDVFSEAISGAALGLSFALGGVAGAAVRGSLVIGGLTLGQTIALTSGLALGTNFIAGMGTYAIQNAGNDNFHVGAMVLNGFTQTWKGTVNYVTGGMLGAVGAWNIGQRLPVAQSISGMIIRSASKYAITALPMIVLDSLLL